ncbi:MAG: bifunctional UDP-N-acetylglucosamine diphosphorylase/glucosamine-1-phosphate N-acetyltransferase GlmU [Alphaproteobacteria bacterium]|nr:bifunctional UDP-N-acetylglucosamine diphosphorylase/glucosamine-1-phosphate N-acetyltransferase GlmU [Alphaproteobacteria bacterium]
MSDRLAAVVLAAGKGTRMKSDRSKVLHAVAGKRMIDWVLDALGPLGVDPIVVVTAPDQDTVRQTVLSRAGSAIQHETLGTGDAVKAARGSLEGWCRDGGTVLVLFGDTPMITPATLAQLIETRRGAGDPAVCVLGFEPKDPALYGRLVTGPGGGLERIVEARDAGPAERAIRLCNGGVMAIDAAVLFAYLDRLENSNTKGEYYLTDLVGIAREQGRGCAVITCDPIETLGVDARAGLARAEAAMQARLRRAAMEGGATLIAPETVFLSHDTRLGRDVTVQPHVVFGPGVVVEDGVEIRAFSHLEGARVASGAVIGPYARLRPGAEIGQDARVGNFVEVKAATLEAGAKVNHLSYIGDARVGAGANIGAGTITCNYDGFAKHRTDIGAGVFVGSNSALIAPVTIADGAIIGAGSTVTTDVPADAVAVVRAEARVLPGGAIRFRARRTAGNKTED